MWSCYTAGLLGILLRAATAVARAGLAVADNIMATLLFAGAVAEHACAPPTSALRTAHIAALRLSWSAASEAGIRARPFHCDAASTMPLP